MADIIKIPGYRIEKKLGEGDLATVYLGIQEKLNRKVAIKVLEQSILRNEIVKERFLKEAKAAAILHHSNITSIYTISQTDNYHYIIMEYLEESLKIHIERNEKGKIHSAIALDIVEAIMGALDYAHSLGIYHRDIKPDNIMFRQDSTPVLVDFGITRALDSSIQLTKAGVNLEMAQYISPEYCKGEEGLDGRSDIYSLGVVLFEMLTGRKPYEDKTTIGLAVKHIEAPIPNLPKSLNRYQPLIDKMMEKRVSKRLGSVAEFRQLLDRVLIRSESSQAKQVAHPISQIGMTIGNTIERKPIKDGYRRYTFKMKIETVILVILVIIIVFIGIFNGIGNKNNTESSINLGLRIKNISVNPTWLRDDKHYQVALKIAHGLYKKGDIENLEKSLALIDELKRIRNTPESNELRKSIANGIKQIDTEFYVYFTNARNYFKQKNFVKAIENVLQAKQLRNLPELTALERIIEKSYFKSLSQSKKKTSGNLKQ